MRELERDKERLLHIMEAIDTIAGIPEQRNLRDLSTDKLFFWGVVKCIENIGEAANHLTKELCEQHPEVEWRLIVGMRNVMVHGYYQASPEDIWDTLCHDIPDLQAKISNILAEIE